MASGADISLLLDALQKELAAKSASLVPWFAANRPRIATLTKIITVFEGQLAPGLGLSQAANVTLDQARQFVVERYPLMRDWFDANILLLRLITLRVLAANKASRIDQSKPAPRRIPAARPKIEALDKAALIGATVEPLPLPTDPPNEFVSILSELVGKADRIQAFIVEHGLGREASGDGSATDATGLALLSRDMLKDSLKKTIEEVRSSQNRRIEDAARQVNQLNKEDPQSSPSTALLRLPASLDGAALRIQLDTQAARSAAAVAGLIVFLRAFRPSLEASLSEAIRAAGSLDSSWLSATIQGEQIEVRHLDPVLVNLLVGARLAENIRIVGSAADPQSLTASRGTQDRLGETSVPADLLTPARRTEANLAATSVLARGEPYSPHDRYLLAQYSGFGGLSIEKIRNKVPPEWLPEERGLIHEYYTPTSVAQAIAEVLRPRLKDLEDGNGIVRALEPSAGIGRLLRAASGDGFDSIRWFACEYSRISSALLRGLRPDISVFNQAFEQFVAEHLAERGLYQLVVSNPPYGERGAAALLDKDREYRERPAWLYQMRRSLEFLQAGGIGVYLIPAGFMTGLGKKSIEARRKILLTAHLMAAFRLPSETEAGQTLFPGALLVTDVVFLRARGGLLPAIAPDDEAIVNGGYFKRYPSHILGREVGKDADDDDQARKPRYGYQVRGDFNGIPAFEERPICRDCTPILFSYDRAAPKAAVPLDEPTAEALQLARRVSAYFSDIAKGDESSTQRARAAQPELREAVLAWHAQDPPAILRIAGHLKRVPELQPLFSAFSSGRIVASLETPPTFQARFQGNPDDIPALTTFLHGSDLDTTLEGIGEFHRGLGGVKSAEQIRAELAAAGYAIDQGRAIPAADYYSGALWERYDRATVLAAAGDEMAAVQASRLLDVIRPVGFADLQIEPRLGWVPAEVLTAFLRSFSASRYRDDQAYEVVRDGPFLTLKDVPYDSLPFLARDHVYEILGYLNHDLSYFKPDRNKDENLDRARERRAEYFKEAFGEWIEANGYWQGVCVNAFNRTYRGWHPPIYPKQPLLLTRWNESKPLFGYQWAGVRRLDANHGGGLFFDVGLGKTRTILAALALARQSGWARRPVIVVPITLIFNWLAEAERVMPDYRVVVIGVKRKSIRRGARKGEVESETDTPRERADKWERFKAGLYDVAIVTYSSLSRTMMRKERLLEIVRRVPAIKRTIGLQARSVQIRIATLEKKRILTDEQRAELKTLREQYKSLNVTERRAAIQNEQEEAFVANLNELPEGQEHDPGIYWDDLGIDWMACDESHIAKNLWTIGPREGGALKFLGAPQAASGIALQVFFRCAIVRQNAGGRGIQLGDATPAKNSPLEFLSLLSLLDDNVWERLGIIDSEQYVTQFLKIEKRLVTDTDLSVVEAPCVVGFKNLDQLREVLFRYGEFRTAGEVGLKIPKPEVYQIEVNMDDAQEAKYRRYIFDYTQAISAAGRDPAQAAQALGLLARMSLTAVHARLDDPPEGGWSLKNFTEVDSFSSPKLAKLAELVTLKPTCGHLIFLENVVAHYWLREVLVAAGVPRDRIAILNGEVTPTPLSRQRVAEGFTSDTPKYDVVIANRVAYEGLNLQVRTCAIYHGDLPWEPATLQQRNGRALRQGNKYDVIEIYYVLSARSMDGARFELIRGKREWMAELIESAASETNNPAAQTNMSPEEWLIFLSRDKEQTRLLIADRKAKIKASSDARDVKVAWANVRSIALRQRDAQSSDIVMRTRIFEQIGSIADDLELVDGDVWPWKFILPLIVKNPVISFAPKAEGAVWTGARYTSRNYKGEIANRGEFGRVLYDPRLAVGYRRYRSVKWEELVAEQAAQIWEPTRPKDWQEEWEEPVREEVRPALDRFIAEIQSEGVWIFRQARFDLATESFREAIAVELPRIAEALRASEFFYQARVPLVRDGLLIDDPKELAAATLLPFTTAGYEEFLRLATSSNLKWTDLNSIADWWWGRSIPRNLLSLADKQLRAA